LQGIAIRRALARLASARVSGLIPFLINDPRAPVHPVRPAVRAARGLRAINHRRCFNMNQFNHTLRTIRHAARACAGMDAFALVATEGGR
jgi:hypothetical protein